MTGDRLRRLASMPAQLHAEVGARRPHRFNDLGVNRLYAHAAFPFLRKVSQ